MFTFPTRFPDWPPIQSAVAKAVSAQNLKRVASQNQEAQVLLGLTFLARAGDPVRRELAQMAATARPEYKPVVAVLALTMDGVDENALNDLLQADADNALGHYLHGTLRHMVGGRAEALEAFRRAATCAELRLYESDTGEALFKAIDALGLQGAERLCALSWMASRAGNFLSIALQPVAWALSEIAQEGDKAEIADLLFRLGGQLSGLNLRARLLGQRAMESALMLKAELAAVAGSADVNGYTAILEAMVGQWMTWPGFEDQPKLSELLQFLPDRIHRAFAMADEASAAYLGEFNVELTGDDKAAFEQARNRAAEAAAALLRIALTDPDGIVGPFLKGLPPRPITSDGRPCVPQLGPVGKVVQAKPELLKAAADNEVAMRALWRAGQNDPRRRNMARLMQLGWGLLAYANRHDNAYPSSLDALFQEDLAQPLPEAKSLLTGRPFVYLGSGEKQPSKSNDAARLILLYDDDHSQGCYECFFAAGYGGAIAQQDLRDQLRKRGNAAN